MTASVDKPRVFLTGASGFIGGEVVRILEARGYAIANYDIAAPHFNEQERYWVEGDVRDGERLSQEIARFRPHFLLHLASDTDVSITQINEFTSIIDGTKNVIDAAAAAPDLKKFIHVSTQFVVRPGVEPRDEKHLDPYTVYGEAKAEAERSLWKADLGMEWLILRPVIIWGPHHPTFAHQIFRHIATGAYLHPKGSDPIMRAFGFVRNVAHQMVSFLEMPKGTTSKHVFYVGDETIDYDVWADAFSVALRGKPARRIPQRLLALLGLGGDIAKKLGLPAPIDSHRVFRMSTSSAVDLESTTRLVGPAPVSFAEGVAETAAHLRTKHADIYTS